MLSTIPDQESRAVQLDDAEALRAETARYQLLSKQETLTDSPSLSTFKRVFGFLTDARAGQQYKTIETG